MLFSIYDLYRRARQTDGGQVGDLQKLKELAESTTDNEERVRVIEKSSIYLGYKLFWIMKLLLNGKKFPQGNIKESKWRSYTHDIVQFLSSPDILRDLAAIDGGETLFQVVTVIFMKSSKPYELVLLGRDDFFQTSPAYASQRYQTHIDFLKDMDAVMLDAKKVVPEDCTKQYLFFVANVVVKNRDIKPKTEYFYPVTRELLKYHQEYLDFNHSLQQMGDEMKKPAAVSTSNGTNSSP